MSRKTLYVLAGAAVFLVALVVTIILYRDHTARGRLAMQAGINFQPYISAYTSGSISNRSSIQVVFTRDVAPADGVGGEASSSLMKFSPRIKGTLSWVNARTLEFVPAEPLKPDTEFMGRVPLKKLFEGVPKEAEEFAFSFRTIRQQIELTDIFFRAEAQGSNMSAYLQGLLTTADEASLETVESGLSLQQGGKAIGVTLTQGESNCEFVLRSDEIDPNGGGIDLRFSGKVLQCDDLAVTDIELPSQDRFYPYTIDMIDGEAQRIDIYFNRPVSPEQNLTGLIYAEGAYDLRFRVEGNRVSCYPGNRLDGTYTFHITSGLQDYRGQALNDEFTSEMHFTGGKPAVDFLQSGTVLPATGQVQIPFSAQGLRGVDVVVFQIFESNIAQYFQVSSYKYTNELERVGRPVARKTILFEGANDKKNGKSVYALDLSKIISLEPGAIYRVGLSMRPELATYECDGVSNDQPIQDIADMPLPEPSYDGTYYFLYDYDYDWRERNNPCNNYYYMYRGTTWTNILVSNIGLIAKCGEGGEVHVFTTSLTESRPLSGVKVQLLDEQLQVLGEATSDNEGRCQFGARQTGKPMLVIATLGEQSSYLRIKEYDALSMSTFDVSGQTKEKGLQGFFYGERGVWRPGDSIFMTLIVEDKGGVLPASHPVEFTLYNSRGQQIDRTVVPGNELKMYSYVTSTAPDAPTGSYRVVATIGEAKFYKYIRVETVKPNRLKVNLNFDDAVLDGSAPIGFTLASRWLHGAPARNLKAEVDVRFWQLGTPFKEYRDYEFCDMGDDFNSYETTFFNGYLDADGVVRSNARIERPGMAPGMLNATFRTRVYETGGGYSISSTTRPYSPYSSYVGVCAPKSDQYYLETDKKQTFKAVVLDYNGRPVRDAEVAIAVYKLSWNWWWEHDNTSFSSYINSKSVALVDDLGTMTTNGKGEISFNVEIKYPDWGRYVVRLSNRQSGHVASRIVYWDWPSSRPRGADRNAEGSTVLAFTSDKNSYNVGEKAEIRIPTPVGGSLLVSIEDASRVLQTMWVAAQEGETKVEIPVTAAMAPNVYAHVTLIQPYGQTVNDLPLRLYGVIPLMVENPDTHLQPVIDAPEEVRPDGEVRITVKEKKGKPMTFTLAMVDEGLLDLTGFKTPDPWTFFYARQALGVRTMDLFDNVIGAYGGRIGRVLSIGGGDEAAEDGTTNIANRFKPAVRFFGPYQLGKGDKRDIRFVMPEYIGSVRLMAIAAHEGSYGASDQTMAVKSPLMVQATLPRVLATNESLSLPVTIFAMGGKIKKANVTVSAEGPVKTTGMRNQSVTFDSEGDKTISFPIRTTGEQGVARVEVVAESGGETARHTIEIGVRNPNPRTMRMAVRKVTAGQSVTLEESGFTDFDNVEARVEVSGMPPIPASRLLQYMRNYPHRGLESQTSQAFVKMLYPELVQCSKEEQERLAQEVRAFIGRMAQFQLPNGGFCYWPGNSRADYWTTSYVGHFMQAAKARGYRISSSVLSKWIRYQQTEAKQWSPNRTGDNSMLMQAYRLYTLALAGSPQLGAMNRLRENKGLPSNARWRLAAAYGIAGNKNAADKLVSNAPYTVEDYSGDWYCYGSGLRDRAMLLEALTRLQQPEKALGVMQEISTTMSSDGWFSTQEIGFGMLAVCEYAKAIKAGLDDVKGEITTGGRTEKFSTQQGLYSLDATPRVGESIKVNFTNTSKGTLFVTLSASGISPTVVTEPTSNHLALGVSYLSMDGQSIDVRELQQGTDFVVRVDVQNPGLKGDLSQLALQFGLPAGWEARNTSMEGETNFESGSYLYQDFRDDAVYTYFNLTAGQSKTFYFVVSASYCGEFKLPPVRCGALYDGNVNATSAGTLVRVVQ